MTTNLRHYNKQQGTTGESPPLDPQEACEQIDRDAAVHAANQPQTSEQACSLTNWLNTEQAAQYLGIPVGSLRNMTSNGQVPYFKLGRRNRYRLSDLHELLLSGKRGS